MKEERRRYSLLSSCIFLSLQLIMTRLLFDAGETVFHFLLTSNSRYLILTGNAKLEDVTPTVLQSSVPQESRANMKNKALEIISFLLF